MSEKLSFGIKNGRARWSDEDRQRFADRNVLKARTVPSKRAPEPEPDEWDEDWFYWGKRVREEKVRKGGNGET